MSTSPAPPTQIRLMGVPISVASQAEINEFLAASIEAGEGGSVFAANTDVVRMLTKKPELLALFESATIVTPDGMPIVMASKIQRQPVPERVTNSYFLRSFTTVAAEKGFSTFYLGGNPGAAEACVAVLKEQEPGLKVAGTYCPPFGFEKDPAEMEKIREQLRQAKPDMVYVGLGVPKQERLIEALIGEFPKTWFMVVGIGFSYIAGEVKQGPLWAHKLGMEWLIRLFQEPKRLFRRYFVDDLPFLFPLFRSALKNRPKPDHQSA